MTTKRGFLGILSSTILVAVAAAAGVHATTPITIGYLTIDQVWVRGRQGRLISGALSYAIEEVNRDPDILNNYTIHLIWNDTLADSRRSIRLLTEQWRAGAVAFFGPEDTCDVEGRVAAAWNLPMISYKCADNKVSDKKMYPTFARTQPPVKQIIKAIISLLIHYKWHRFTLIVGNSSSEQSIEEKLIEQAKAHNITLNGKEEFKQPHSPFTTGNPFPNIVQRTYIDTRVYIFLGDRDGLVDFMRNLYDRGLLDTGEYIVIYVDHITFKEDDALKYFLRYLDSEENLGHYVEAFRSLLVVTASGNSNPNWAQFCDTVDRYNEKHPFEFPNPFNITKQITVYAAYLYDAVKLYAQAADEVTKEGGNITNGTAIINKIRNRKYKSIRGVTTQIDNNGDAEGNYTLLARVPFASKFLNYSMRPVGYFQLVNGNHDLRIFPDHYIDWVGGKPPIDEPPCGYRGQKCIPKRTYTLQIVGGVLGGILIMSVIISYIIYRKRRYEQKIAGLQWKIPREHIRYAYASFSGSDERRGSFGSKYSLNSQNSFDSRLSFTQIYTRTASYKGQIVATKMYEKKNLVISRKMQKEMKVMRDIRHNNVNAFIGASINPPSFMILTEYCAKGSLQDILENEDVKLDDMFKASLIKDIIQGMKFLQSTELCYHGNLKSSNCVINSRWTLQVADFGLLDVRAGTYRLEDEHAFFRNLFWKAPEHLRNPSPRGSPKGDVYSFAIILHEIIGRAGPYGYCNMEPKSIIEAVKQERSQPFRPDLKSLKAESYVTDCMKECWAEDPEERPDFMAISKMLSPMRKGMKRNICDNMITMMESYQLHLEELVEARTDQLIEEKKKTEALLHRMLPSSIADQLKRDGQVEPEVFSSVTIYFSDICGFTELSAESTPMQVVDLLNKLYTCFDSIIKNYDVYKVETIGDAYMVVSGVPIRNGDNHAGEIASMSLELLGAIKSFTIPHKPDRTLKLRIGIHTGPCVAGVVGLTMPRYTLFGDTVNTASRMESNGEALKIHCSKECKELLDKLGGYQMKERGFVNMKGKGQLFTYWLLMEDEKVRHERLKRCSEVFKYNSAWARESRRAYLRHQDQHSASIIEDSDQEFCNMIKEEGDRVSLKDQPLVEILRESENKSYQIDVNNLGIPGSTLEKADSPKVSPNRSFKSPIVQKPKYHMNGLISADKRLRARERSGSGQDLMESTALLSFPSDSNQGGITGMDVRHSSFSTRTSHDKDTPNGKLGRHFRSTENNNSSQLSRDRCDFTQEMC